MHAGRRDWPRLRWLALAWVAGCALALAGAGLSPLWLLAAGLGGALLAAIWDHRALVLVAALLGALWTTQVAASRLAERLPVALEGKTLTVVGHIANLPDVEPGRMRFQLTVAKAEGPRGRAVPWLHRIALVWYRPPVETPRAGEYWRFRVRLRRPRGLANPASYDYAGWALAHGIDANGYVYRNEAVHVGGTRHGLTALRARIARAIHTALGTSPYSGLVTGLAVGARAGITQAQWQTLRATGTTHLLAISGLHLGLVAAFVFLLVNFGVRRVPALVERVPARLAAAGAGAAAALAYAALAGFSLPTERALLMMALPFVALALRRRVAVADALAFAAIVVTLLAPLAVLTAGFWLSFGAVAALIYGLLSAKPGRGLVRAQLVVSLALAPLVAAFFGQISLVGPAANLIAIPTVGWVVVPATLLGAFASLVHTGWGAPLFHAAAAVLAWLWPFLQWLSSRSFAVLTLGPVGWLALGAAVVGVACLLAPRGLGVRMAGAVLLLPLLWPQAPPRPTVGEARVTVLDVGQGLAAVVTTAHHVLLVDTGPRWWAGNDAGRSIVIPYLAARHLGSPDLVVLSHVDADHAGGLDSIEARWPGLPVLSSERQAHHPCRRGEHWYWDGVRFAILGPDVRSMGTRNNRSCVLKVETAGSAILFPGDIEAEEERRLVGAGERLAADILVAPHHGSATSSTPGFIRAVKPEFVVFAVGYRNRYGFPRAKVLARYRQAGAVLLDSAHDGTVSFVLGARGGVRLVSRYRPEHKRPWKDP